jgi:(2Fe-2S) ferredoxin
VLTALQESVKKHNATERLEVVGGGCLGMCGYGPNAMVISNRRRIGYCHLTPADAGAIINAHADDDRPVERLRIKRNSNLS